MFTPEDDIDELHRERGRWLRRREDAERARHDGRGCDYVQIDKTILRATVELERIDRALMEQRAELLAADEAYEQDAAA